MRLQLKVLFELIALSIPEKNWKNPLPPPPPLAIGELTELEVDTRRYFFWHSRRMDRTQWEQMFPVWNEISVNESFIAKLHKQNIMRWNFTELKRYLFC